MTEKRKLSEVFKTVGLPPYTYVKPSYYGEVRADIEQPGKHLLIEGPSGVGKTCIIYKVFEELGWKNGEHYRYLSCRDQDADQVIKSFLDVAKTGNTPSTPILVVDDFHLLKPTRRADVGSELKRLSDRTFEQPNPPKVVLMGIPTTGISLLSEAYDLGPRLGSYRFSRATDVEIDRLISEGENALNVLFEDREIVLSESAGNFWLAQYICNKICASKEVFETLIDIQILTFDLLGIRRRLMNELSIRYLPIARTFSKGKKWRPGGNKPYLEVLTALTKIPESVVTFDKILNVVPERRRPGIKAIRHRIPEVIHDPDAEVDLRKQIAFEPDSGFSIEDPLFRYFLSNLNPNDLYKELGIESDSVERTRVFTYDVGFSFAGEARRMVEIVNDQLKAEDVVTFYDYDQQAFLLAMDLEKTLGRLYNESCRFYLVFLDKNYREKVWTKFERDIMTQSGRARHIIPVLLEEEGATGTFGIPGTLGRIDLRDLWKRIQDERKITEDIVNAIRNRCVLPLLEKIDTPDYSV